MAAANDSNSINRKTFDALLEALNHLEGAEAVLDGPQKRAENVPCRACSAAELLLQRAFDIVESEADRIEKLNEPACAYRLAAAIELAQLGADNDRGNDDPASGLSCSLAWLAMDTIRSAAQIIEGVRASVEAQMLAEDAVPA